MDPNTLNLILFIEGLVALAAKSVVDLKSVLDSSSTQTAAQHLADADAMYAALIAKVKGS